MTTITTFLSRRRRDAAYPAPPAQRPACGTTAPGSTPKDWAQLTRPVGNPAIKLLAGLALLALGQTPVLAATINVGAGCTLVNAITSANDDAGVGACSDGAGADTLVLPAGSTQNLTAPNFGVDGLPAITTPIIIQGNGSTIRRTPPTAMLFRIFEVVPTGRLTLQQITVSGGKLTTGGGSGGAVLNNGVLTVTGSTLSGNAADIGGGIANGSDGTRGAATVINSTISDNTATFGGGGVTNPGSLTMTNSTISGNTAGDGGGMFNLNSFTLTNSTISGNHAVGAPGIGGDGGGISNNDGGGTLTHCAISRNTAQNFGGGVDNFGGDLTLDSTLISGNTAPTGREVRVVGGSVAANNFNLFGFNGISGVNGFLPGANDIVPPAGVALTDILDITLADNAPGTTQTHALIAGSPALDAVKTGCPPPPTDQRGVTRPQGTACDIGAFELEGTQPTAGMQFSAPTFNVAEAAGSATLTVTRSGAATIPASADLAASGGTATPGADFTVPPAAVALAAGETSKTFSVPILNDTDMEGPETVNLSLSNPVGATLGTQSTAVLTIKDDDSSGGGSTAKCNGLIATTVGTASAETLNGTPGPDVINGLGGNDKIFGLGGNDAICGGGGNDQINGGPGSDQCNGGSGTDTAAACEVKLNIP